MYDVVEPVLNMNDLDLDIQVHLVLLVISASLM